MQKFIALYYYMPMRLYLVKFNCYYMHGLKTLIFFVRLSTIHLLYLNYTVFPHICESVQIEQSFHELL